MRSNVPTEVFLTPLGLGLGLTVRLRVTARDRVRMT